MHEISHNRLAKGYGVISRNGERSELKYFQAKSIAPAAGFSSTVKDLATFASWQFKIQKTTDSPILNGNTLNEMQRVHWIESDRNITRGLGFGIYKNNNIVMVGHSGECPGCLS